VIVNHPSWLSLSGASSSSTRPGPGAGLSPVLSPRRWHAHTHATNATTPRGNKDLRRAACVQHLLVHLARPRKTTTILCFSYHTPFRSSTILVQEETEPQLEWLAAVVATQPVQVQFLPASLTGTSSQNKIYSLVSCGATKGLRRSRRVRSYDGFGDL